MDEERQPAFDEAPRPVAAQVDPRRYYAVIGALVVVIVFLAVRPWDLTGSSPGPAATREGGLADPARTQPARIPAATPARVLTGLEEELRITCGWPSGWRAASLQAWSGRDQPVRSWMAIEPVEASGPLDPAIPFAPIFTESVPAIGFCAPLGDQQPPSGARGELYALEAGRANLLAPVAIEPSETTALGVLWVPGADDEGSGSPRVWPPGSYVIELVSENGDYRRWLGIEIHDLDAVRSGPPVTPTPLASAPASPASPGSSPGQTD